ncbi:MAG: type II toxin-antitoxin system YafQ family toxin [Synergistaceae bacterium]|nr:type II toxin-antitoxin system YafQ family toxin [Synergistaceae bacterium]
MRDIDYTNEFKRNFRRAGKGKYRNILKNELWEVVDVLANDGLLSYSYRDHPLIGKWVGCRECHLAFDLVLIYRYEGNDKLILHRLGTHSEVLGL